MVWSLGEDPEGCESAQQTIERTWLSADRGRDGREVLRPVLEQVGNSELCSDMDHLRGAKTHDEVTQSLSRAVRRVALLSHHKVLVSPDRNVGMRSLVARTEKHQTMQAMQLS